MKNVEELKAALLEYGYVWMDEVNVEYNGLTQIFTKDIEGVRQTLYAHTDSCGGEYYWLLELGTHYGFYPRDAGWSPIAWLSIQPLFEEHIPKLPDFAAQLTNAREQLKPVKES